MARRSTDVNWDKFRQIAAQIAVTFRAPLHVRRAGVFALSAKALSPPVLQFPLFLSLQLLLMLLLLLLLLSQEEERG
jgi:hypothetical protein